MCTVSSKYFSLISLFAPPFNLFILLGGITSGENSFEVGLRSFEVKRGLLTSVSLCESLSKLVMQTFLFVYWCYLVEFCTLKAYLIRFCIFVKY